MSEESRALVRDAINAFSDEGVEATLEYLDSEIEWWAPPEWLEDRLYKGHEGIRRLAEFWMQQFDEYRLDPERFVDLADGRVAALLYQRGRIKGSGVLIEQPIGWIARIGDGLVKEIWVYFSWEATLEAAELQE